MSSTENSPIRIANVIDGHVHPALCRTEDGDLLAVYNIQGGGGKELLLCRSADGGRTWSTPAPISEITDDSIYPGSLTRLQDGRILLNWSCYYKSADDAWRVPSYSISADGGHSWSPQKGYPVTGRSNYTCMRHPVVELSAHEWVCPFYDRTVSYDAQADRFGTFGDGRNHGMVPIVRTNSGAFISGAPQSQAPVPVGVGSNMVRGLRSTDAGQTWDTLQAFGHFGVAGYDLTPLDNGWVVFTSIVYGVGVDGEFSYELILSRDDGRTWETDGAVEVYNPGRRIGGRGWPRTVQLDGDTLATLFYDLSPAQEQGPGLYLVRTSMKAFC